MEPLKILVIEDHAATAVALCKLLERRIPGCVCTITHHLKTGLCAARSCHHDITLLDLGLPDAGTDQVICSIPLFPKPVIVLTDMDDDDFSIELKCYAYEAENFYTKKQLRAEILSNEGVALINAITKAHWRNTLPARRSDVERFTSPVHGTTKSTDS